MGDPSLLLHVHWFQNAKLAICSLGNLGMPEAPNNLLDGHISTRAHIARASASVRQREQACRTRPYARNYAERPAGQQGYELVSGRHGKPCRGLMER